MPDKVFASGFGLGIVRTVEYGQVQRIDTFAAVGILVSVSVNARGCVRFAMPGEAFAGGFGFGVVRAVEDGQVQRIDAFAAISVLVCVSVNP